MKRKKRIILLAASLLVAVLLVVGVVYAGTVVIDDFNEGDESYFVSGGTSGSATYDNAGILGGERDSTVYAYGNFVIFQVDQSDNNRLDISAASNATYTSTVTWDGNDSDATSLDAVGLSGANLVSNTNDGLLASIVFKDQGLVEMEVRVYTGTNWSTMTVTLPNARVEEGERVDIFFPFSDFNTAGGAGAVFTDVGAIEIQFDGTLDTATDIAVDNLEASSVREYGDLPVSLYTTSILSATHIPGGLRLGYNCDAEATHSSSADSQGDDNDFDDEDGVVGNTGEWSGGADGGSLVVSRLGCSSCYINGWIDWNRDGDFGDTVDGADEHIINNPNRTSDNSSGETFTFDTPTNVTSTTPITYFARFRICEGSTDCDDPGITDTDVNNGEIEDYLFEIHPTAVELSAFTATWQDDAVEVAWETALEDDTAGFNLWRSTTASGSYARINDTLIQGKSPGETQGGSYAFTDEDVTPETTYHYKLEELETGGASTWYGPVTAEVTQSDDAFLRVYLPVLLH